MNNHVPSAYLVMPEPGDRTVARLQQGVRKLALRTLLSYPLGQLDSGVRRIVSSLRAVLPGIVKRHGAVLLDALGNVDVQTPLLVAAVGPAHCERTPSELFAAALPPLLTTLSHRAHQGVIPETVLHDLPLHALTDDDALRRFVFSPPARGMLVDPLGAEVRLHNGELIRLPRGPKVPPDVEGLTHETAIWRLHPDLPRLHFSMIDPNPLSMFEAHPDKDGNQVSLGEKSLETWLEAFHEALELIRVALPGWFEEIKTSMRRVIPVGYLPERHLSASYREAPNMAYFTLCDSPLTIAEALIHETQHTKANLLSWLDPIVHNAHTTWTKSPVRPDLRPLWGVLLAVHAFVPVSALHHRLAELDHPITRSERFPRRRAEVLAGNNTGMTAVLESADPTTHGGRMIREMNTLHRFLVEAAPEPPPGLDLDPLILPPS